MDRVSHLSEVTRHQSPAAVERHASALADIQKMHEDLVDARNDNGQLRADLARAFDRVALLVEDRDRYRWEASKFRDKLVELVILQTNIASQCRQAEEIVKAVRELFDREHAPADEELAEMVLRSTEGNSAA